jgi:hypothetical protein
LDAGDAVGGEEASGSGQEPSAGAGLLIGEHLGIGQAGVVINGGMDEVVARPTSGVAAAVLGGVAAMDAVAAAGAEPAQLLDVEVDQLARVARS